MKPTVSCICVTGKDSFHLEHFLPVAIKCFFAQTYPAALRELILVSERELPPGFEQSQVSSVVAKDARTLGDLRNAGLDAARGEFCMQWDDDDWHHPDRIEKQVAALGEVPARWLDVSACFLYRQLCYSFGSDTAFVREFPDTFMHGTILHRNLGDRRYRPLEREEDSCFLSHFPAPIVLDNDPKLYIRFAHGRNTWPEEHLMLQTSSLRHHWLVNDAEADLIRSVLASDYAGVPRVAWNGSVEKGFNHRLHG